MFRIGKGSIAPRIMTRQADALTEITERMLHYRDDWQLSPEMSQYHNDPATEGAELKFIHEDGREAVYTPDGSKLVTDPRYAGTYNYVNPASPSWNPLRWPSIVGRGLGHFFADMVPYYIGGNVRGPEDPCKE